LRALEEISGGADGRAYTQASLLIFGRRRISQLFLNVLYVIRPLRLLVIDHQQLSTRCLCSMASASVKVVPTGTVMRFSFVITLLMEYPCAIQNGDRD